MRNRYGRGRLIASIAAVAAAATAAVLCTPAVGAANASSSARNTAHAAAGAAIRYAREVPLCAQPADPQAVRCFAVARVPVPKGTAGAYRYTEAAGAARGPAGGYTPADLAKAYGFDPRLNRSKLTVGVVLWYDDPYARADLNRFDRHYGFKRETARSFRKVNGNGKAHPLPQADRNASAEISLDLQTIRATCRTCRILLVEASTATDSALATAENTAVRLGAQVVNNSYGETERRLPARVRNAYNHPGHVIVAATGDDGWYGWDFSNTPGEQSAGRAQFPSVSPNVVAVGGTSLALKPNGTREAETVWDGDGPADEYGTNVPPPGASGGGCSRAYAAKPWQRHQHGYFAAHCNGNRLTADVSADADPQTGFDVYDTYENGWVTIGGTSLSAPLISGMYALAGGSRGVRYASSQLYVNSDVFPKRRFDVREGGNGFCGGIATSACATDVYNGTAGVTHNPNNLHRGIVDCSFPRHGRDATHPPLSHECNAATGYDGTSGVGAPTGLRLFHATAPTVRITRPAHKPVGQAGTYLARVRERVPHTHVTSYTWAWGDGRSTTTRRTRVQHTYRHAGIHHITLTVEDSRYQVVVAHTATRSIHR